MSWNDGHQVDGQAAYRRGDEDRFIYGGERHPGGQGHGEIESRDGLNANYVRDPGGKVVVNEERPNPYATYQSDVPRHQSPGNPNGYDQSRY